MNMRRRDFLTLIAGGALASVLPSRVAAVSAPVLSAWAEGEGLQCRYFAGRLDGPAIELPARGHALLVHPAKPDIAYVCARRPGEYLIQFDAAHGCVLAQAEADEMHRFEGHAIIDGARNRLLATESELDHGQGRIGVYDADSLEKLDEWPTHGIGPHELLWLEPNVIAVANGGILTLPETGRIKRNLDTMRPSLVLLDARDGRLLADYRLPESKLSIRHLARAQDGTLGVALQQEGGRAAVPFALLRNGSLTLADPPAVDPGRYAAAVAVSDDRFAVTCTHADRVVIWDARGRFRAAAEIPKPAGITATREGWVISNEFGQLMWLRRDGSVSKQEGIEGRCWDNHMVNVDWRAPCIG